MRLVNRLFLCKYSYIGLIATYTITFHLELKSHFNLGKKNWFQLVKGKLVDLTVNKVLKETIIKEIYDGLSDGFETTTQFLDKM